MKRLVMVLTLAAFVVPTIAVPAFAADEKKEETKTEKKKGKKKGGKKEEKKEEKKPA